MSNKLPKRVADLAISSTSPQAKKRRITDSPSSSQRATPDPSDQQLIVSQDEDDLLVDYVDFQSDDEDQSLKLEKIPNNSGSGGGGIPILPLLSAQQQSSNSVVKDEVSHLFAQADYTYLPLKRDHASRPLWICPDTGNIILEAFSPIADLAQDFLTAIAEPVTRPSLMHEYRLTTQSLYAAVSVGLETDSIIEVLNRLCKIPVPAEVCTFIQRCTESYGKVKLVLKQSRYYVESSYQEKLQFLLKDETIRLARVNEDSLQVPPAPLEKNSKLQNKANLNTLKKALNVDDTITATPPPPPPLVAATASTTAGVADDEEEESEDVHAFEIAADKIGEVRKRANELDIPLLEEYDFRNDTTNPNLEIDLKPITVIRPYQEKSLSKMFGNGRARSGIIVLPCGAGKTLVGITAACTIKKSTLVLCTSSVSAYQWKQQFMLWSNIKERNIAVFTSETKERFMGEAGIVVSTYSMVANNRKRSYEAAKMMEFIQSREWGLILLDEVHVVPAQMFRQVVTTVATHAKLGLTATLVREDSKIEDLNFLIGPKLYEANWMDLAAKGHIANVQCAEVWCPMSAEFYAAYLKEKSRKRAVLYVMNPYKLQACQYLIKYHEDRGDKIIVFSDNVYALKKYAHTLKKPLIYGATSQLERMQVLKLFQNSPTTNTIFLSKVGDTSIDLPEATCLIQISSHYGSRRQEAQRLGRILRAKRRNDEGFNAFFYSLVSKDTQEMYYSTKRQRFLVDQGYAFKVITHLQGMSELPGLSFKEPFQRKGLLEQVLIDMEGRDVMAEDESKPDAAGKGSATRWQSGGTAAKKMPGTMRNLTGADTMAYYEQPKKEIQRHKLFRELEKKHRGGGGGS